MEKTEINLDTWKRREHYEVFKHFDEPLFGVVVKLECSAAYKKSKEKGYSFSLFYLYLSLKAANTIEEFRYRIENDRVYSYKTIGAGPTILRDDETYGCAYFPYLDDIDAFMHHAEKEIKRVKAEQGLKFSHPEEDIIHYTTLPWIDFTALNHARKFSMAQSVPKISFGKISTENDKKWLPVDIHVNHALMDGLHVGKFVTLFQNLLNGE